jgi:hypothetical protein
VPKGDKTGITTPHRHDHAAHDQCSSEIIRDRGNEEGKNAGQPEDLTQGKVSPDQPSPKRLEDAALFHALHHRSEVRGSIDPSDGPQIMPAASITGFDFRKRVSSSTMTTT